jgi:hypothetical protein
MHSITDANPHLASKVRALKDVRGKLQANFERIILRLEYVSPDDAAAFGEVCAELECYLEQLRTHGEKERELLQQKGSCSSTPSPKKKVDPDESIERDTRQSRRHT